MALQSGRGGQNDPNDPANIHARIKEANSNLVNLRLEYEKCLVRGVGGGQRGMGCVWGG
jgi:hypothetical protein